MIIREIKKYLSQKKEASIDEICFHIKQNKEIVSHALHLLIQKGFIIEKKIKMLCRSCNCRDDCYDKKKIYQSL